MLMNPVYTEEDLKVVPSHRPVDTARPRDHGQRSNARGLYLPPLWAHHSSSWL